MYKLKELPEDFIVEEQNTIALTEEGGYLICSLTKKEENTEDAVSVIAKHLGIHRKHIGYGGLKDKHAQTTQLVSIKGTTQNAIEKLQLDRIQLSFKGYSTEPMSLGNLKGNCFTLTVRNLDQEEIRPLTSMINYFGEQRFSFHNTEVGELIVKKKFSEACELLVKEDKRWGTLIAGHLQDHPHDFINALQLIPKKILQLYVHAFQSHLWNLCVGRILEQKKDFEFCPLIGFSTEIPSEIEGIVQNVLEEHQISERNFIIKAIPDLSVEGSFRPIRVALEGLSIGDVEDDELNPGKKKRKIRFCLPKASYATECVKQLIHSKN